jgi:glycine hydroxymethyltransferase
MHSDFFTKTLNVIDPEVDRIICLEAERQNRKLIMIPSESNAPLAVRESLGSVLQNIYAEGYPDEKSRAFSQQEILNIEKQLINFRRNSDPRYYKGVEFADVLEELARRRCAELFANEYFSADQIFVNVQPLSGAPANNAVYQALIEPGDAILGMNLFHGGHLTHGSSVNRSGKLYKVSHYSVDPISEKIDYEEISRIAQGNKPKIIIAGYSSYPWVPDWKLFKEIASSVGSYLFADISHIAGMIGAGILPSPIGFADVITFTTHKTLCGPRGACILSFEEKISKKLDRAVFPGEQGGPHVQVFAAMATAFKLAKSDQFKSLQSQIIKNCKSLADQFLSRGIRIAYGGTDTHLLNLDCKTIKGSAGTSLSGDMAARLLDIAGIVVNANTLPGDKLTARASGVRLGTPWISQRGLVDSDMVEIADIITDLLKAVEPYTVASSGKSQTRVKVTFKVLEEAKIRVRTIIDKCNGNGEFDKSDYPFFSYLDDFSKEETNKLITFTLTGEKIRQVINYLLPIGNETLSLKTSIQTKILIDGQEEECVFSIIDDNTYQLGFGFEIAGKAAAWLRDLSDGYVYFDEDIERRIPGPFMVMNSESEIKTQSKIEAKESEKPFFVGIASVKESAQKPALPPFKWLQLADDKLYRTPLYDWHIHHKGKIVPFAGWEMPVWYSSVVEEHLATRKAAGLFDVTHMGVYQVEGVDALPFLDSVCGNDISTLEVGESCYTHFLDPDTNVIDDLLVYYHNPNEYLVVVNAANDAKDFTWLNAVKDGKVKVDNERPWSRCYGRNATLRNLRDPKEKESMRVDLALQGPLSKQILLKAGFNMKDIEKIEKLKHTQLCHALWEGSDLIISRTGYTGEKMAFEIFIHPDASVKFWEKLIEVGAPLGLKPCGLGSRDSLRTEAGLPLYGHEMGGDLNLGVAEAGFDSYIKTYKPWFIGRKSFIEREKNRDSIVIRFRFEQQRVRMAHHGDPVLNDKGKVIGVVTSCAIDSDEFLTGQAFVDKQHTEEGTALYIYQNSADAKDIGIANLSKGKRIALPSKAVVVNRFAQL